MFQSYWDWLPPEIQEHIIQLATAQYIQHNGKNELRNNVCKEILLYGKLKEAWGRGLIKFEKGAWTHYNYSCFGEIENLIIEPATVICGCFADRRNAKRTHYLGSSLENALNYVKNAFKENYLELYPIDAFLE